MKKVYKKNGYAIFEDENGIYISWSQGPYGEIVTYPISRENLKKALQSDHDAYEVMIYAETGKWPLNKEKQYEKNKAFIRKFPELLIEIPENQALFDEEEIKALLAQAKEKIENKGDQL